MFHTMRIAINPHSLQEIKPFVFKILLLPNRRKCTEVNVCTTWAIYMWLPTIFALFLQHVETKGTGKADALGSPGDMSV